MIVSHTNRFIFAAIPKTGSQAVRTALNQHINANDWQQEDLYDMKRMPFKDLAKIRHGHILLREIKPYISQKTWKDYFKFAFVRNPWDRFISTMYFKFGANKVFQSNPLAFMKLCLERPSDGMEVLLRPQHIYVINEKGDSIIDYLGKFEALQNSYDQVCEHIGFETAALKRMNETSHLHYADCYDDELEGLISEKYAEDIRLFGYKFGKSA